MGSMKGDKTTSMQIPPWLEESLKPFITDAVNKGQMMSDAAWQWGMGNNPQFGAGPPSGQPMNEAFPVEGIPKYPQETIPTNRG